MRDPKKLARGSADSIKSILEEVSKKTMPKPPVEVVLANGASDLFKFTEKDPEIRKYLEQKAAKILSQMWRAGTANGTNTVQFAKKIERESQKEIEAMRAEINSRSVSEKP